MCRLKYIFQTRLDLITKAVNANFAAAKLSASATPTDFTIFSRSPTPDSLLFFSLGRRQLLPVDHTFSISSKQTSTISFIIPCHHD